MIRSMTGYGRGESVSAGIRVETELSSVNRKQLETRLNLPRSLAAFESRLVELVQETLSRGQISGSVTLHVSSQARRRGVRLDRALASAYVRDLRSTASALKLRDDLAASILLQLPDVVRHHDAEEDTEAIWTVVRRAFRAALVQLVAMREREGVSLSADIAERLTRLDDVLDPIRRAAPSVTARYREALTGRLKRAGVPFAPNDAQLLKEVTLFAERSDIAEEVTRLGSHLRQARGLLKSREPAGRTLDFLAQEMFREINTIGSKANDVRITRQVIRFKTELERIREQVQNIE